MSGTMQRLKSLENAQGKKTKIIITAPKSCGSERVIPLNDYALALCRRHFTADPAAFVLTGEAGRYVEPRTMQNRLKRVRGGMRAFRGPLSRAAPHVRHQMRRGGI